MKKNNKLKKQILAGLFVAVIFSTFFFVGGALAEDKPAPAEYKPVIKTNVFGDWSSSLNKLGGLKGTSGAQTLIGRVIKTAMGVVGSIALIMFVAGGLMWMTAAGNSEKTNKALQIITWSSLGIVVIFSAYVLTQFVFKAF